MKKKAALSEGLQSINRGGGFAGLLRNTSVQGTSAGAPIQQEESGVSEQPKQRRGRKPNPDSASYSRMCAVVNTELQRKLQEIASKHGLLFKEVLEEAMRKAVEAYEAKYGEIELPEDKQEQAKELF